MTNYDEPADCWWCGQRAVGAGIGFTSRNDTNPKWLCLECLPLANDIRRIKRMDAYEVKASEMAGQKAGELLDKWGVTDMAKLTEEQWIVFRNTMINGYGNSIRELVRGGAPF